MPKEGEIGATLSGGGLELIFTWAGDRFEHTIAAGGESLASSEHPEFETPVFQEVHQQGDLVFASGMSGDRHWSASIEAGEDGFLFDVACRCKTPARAIGSAYQATGVTALRLIEEAIEGYPPPEYQTDGSTVATRIRPAGEPPATYRYRHAVVGAGTR